MYEYKAKLINVVDGDTMDFEVDLGFNIIHKIRVRLAGIDTPEIFTPSCEEEKIHGLAAAQYITDNFSHKEGRLYTQKDKKGKYGRYLAGFRVDRADLSISLINAGFEKKNDYSDGKPIVFVSEAPL